LSDRRERGIIQGRSLAGDEEADMVTIETTIKVDEQGKAMIQLPAEVKPGPYRAVLVVDSLGPAVARSPLTFSAHDVGPWPEGLTVRRKEIYGDDGR
jgi:hypothetical protein